MSITNRRDFLQTLALGAAAAGGLGSAAAAQTTAPKPPTIQGFGDTSARPKGEWKPVSDRKIRVGIVGYGMCKFGAAFGFQDHPNVEIVAVSDLIPDRRAGLMKACRCEKSYESLEELIKDPKIEAVFTATDAPSHARHCAAVMNHGKHVMTAVPATFGSIEEGEKVLETVEKTSMKYMMAETSCFHEDTYAMMKIYQAGGFGRLVYSEGEYFHYFPAPLPSYKEWRVGLPPFWYPTHSTAYYVGVTGKRFTTVSCQGFRGRVAMFQPGGNKFDNPFSDEIALFRTSEGGTSRMLVAWGIQGHGGEIGRVFGELGSMIGMQYNGTLKKLPNIGRPPVPPTMQLGGHGGAHGPITNEFITAILENRLPLVNIYQALAMTVPGIVAHQSALKDGETLKIPQYEPPKA
jgi:predicted dehydrogenase